MLRAFRFPLLVLLGLAGWVAVVDRDPVGALVVPGVALAVLGLVAAGQALGRRRVRARRRALPPGSGLWRAHVEDLFAAAQLFGGGRLAWLVDVLRVDVEVAPGGLVLLPRHRVGGFAPLRLGWHEVARVRAGEPVWELGGKPRPLPLRPVVLALVGQHVDASHRPMTDAEAREEEADAQERAAWDEGLEVELREQHGPDHVFGTRPLRLLVDDPDGLVPLLERYRTGVLPHDSR